MYFNATEGFNGDPWNLITGQTRAVDGVGGAFKGGYVSGINRWMSNQTTWPAWVMLEWNYTLTKLSSIELIFDTGMHRVLRLSQKESDQHAMHWGVPQPETVRDYDIEVRDANEKDWKILVANITGNYQRRRVHNVSVKAQDLKVDAMRINVYATNGQPWVKILEVRVYDSVNGDQSFPKRT